MESLQSLDLTLFRFVNEGLKNPFLDWAMPLFSSNALFVPVLVLLGGWLLWKGGSRGRLMLVFLLLVLALGDGLILGSIKEFIARPRPFAAVNEVQLLVGRGGSPSMPSSHAGNWFAAAVVALVYYRRSIWIVLPMGLIVCFSRVYVGAHYPGDVLAGAVIGAAYAALFLCLCEAAWGWMGPRWFPIWHRMLPSLINPPSNGTQTGRAANRSEAQASGISTAAARIIADRQWLYLAYALIGVVLLGHLAYLAADKIQLSEDEAYQWLWSKHLALSYFSKPPLIAYTQALGSGLWGDTQFGVRFLSPIIGAVGGLLLVRFLAREVSGFVALMSVFVTTATPLLMVGSTLLTIDSLSVLFWVAAMVSGWKAVQTDSLRSWIWTGLWIGLGFLGKYIGLFQWLCWGVFWVLWPPARAQLRRPGPYLALGISLACVAPVLIWNAQHDWITLSHLADRGGLDRAWQPQVRFIAEFILAEAGLLNPVFFVAMIWAATRFWRQEPRNPLLLYLFSMGAPLMLFYLFYTLRSRVQPNWIAPAILPLFCLMLIYWEQRWREGSKAVRNWFITSLAIGLVVIAPLHDTRLIASTTGIPLPAKVNPLKRVLRWDELAKVVTQARAELQTEGKPVFVIGDHYGITSILTFYIPEAQTSVPNDPIVYYQSSDEPENQFWFWPGYEMRKGQNAIYVARVKEAEDCPARLLREFNSVRDLGIREILYKGGVFHRIQLFACRGLL